MKRKIHDLYLDYVNNFLSVEYFCEYYGMLYETGIRIIKLGRRIDKQIFNRRKNEK